MQVLKFLRVSADVKHVYLFDIAVSLSDKLFERQTQTLQLEKLEAFLGAVNSNDNSHLVTVPAGVNVLSDVLISSPVFTGDGEGGSGFAAAAAAGAAAAAAGVGGGDGFNYGVDPNLDPELALALRVSMEEERARQERAAKEAAEKGEGGAEQGESSAAGELMSCQVVSCGGVIGLIGSPAVMLYKSNLMA